MKLKGMQEKFFEELQSFLDDKREGELIVTFRWPNQGHGYIQQQGTFNNLSTFTFDFQVDYATFTVNGKSWHVTYKQKSPESFTLWDVINAILDPIPDPAPLDAQK